MKNKTIIVNTKLADLELYDKEIKKAIKCNWNSLYFSGNQDEFLSLLIGDKLFTLTTIGDTFVIDGHGLIYRNDNQDEIRYLIEDGELDRCIIGEQSKFTLIVEKVIDSKSGVLTTVYEDYIIYEGQPSSIDELEDDMIEIASKYIDTYTDVLMTS